MDNARVDMVEIENLAFNNLYIEQSDIQNKSPSKTSKADSSNKGLLAGSVSRYPRAVMPYELKSRFEVEFPSQLNKNLNKTHYND